MTVAPSGAPTRIVPLATGLRRTFRTEEHLGPEGQDPTQSTENFINSTGSDAIEETSMPDGALIVP